MALGYDGKLYILAFDHRGSFQKKMFGIEGDPTAEQTEQISDAKHLIFEGMLKAAEGGAEPGVSGCLVDEQFGDPKGIPQGARERGLVLAMPVEKSGQNEFDFEYGDDFEDWTKRIRFMVESKVIADYTYLWYDVRPHPNFGTVEVRVMDSQTRVEHTLALAALVQAMVKELAEHFEEHKRLSRYPYEMLDENKWLAARHGLEAELVDLPKMDRVHVRELARRLMDRLRPHAEDLGSLEDFDCLEDILDRGNGAARQVVVYEANHDLREVVGEILVASVPQPADIPRD